MGLKDFIKEAIKEEKNKTPEQRQKEKDEKEKKKLDKISEVFKDYLLDDEKILFHTSLYFDMYLFLDKRILFRSDAVKYHTIPYKDIKRFTIETLPKGVNAVNNILNEEIKLFLGGGQEPSITLKVPPNSVKTINKIILKNIL